MFSLNFSSAGKGPFLTVKDKEGEGGGGLRIHEGFLLIYFRASCQPID